MKNVNVDERDGGLGAGKPPNPASMRAPAVRPWSEIKLTIDVPPQQVRTEVFGAIPGGTRLHVNYNGGTVRVKSNTDERPREGVILSGVDWVLIRSDGVAVFDTRLTFRVNEGEDAFVFDGLISGQVDLLGGIPPEQRGDAADSWRKDRREIEVVLPVRFEAAGSKQDWVAKRFQVSPAMLKAYGYLAIHQFVAFGAITVNADGTVGRVHLEVAAIQPRAGV